ncbi:MAG: hypothetical protein M1832_000077 [Thelocarpon impressellum]|nr:MAG: hypothetical protein M1832_000077 [Thelocarpon impressellum]
MADPTSEADKIRNKRLAKLQSQAPAQSQDKPENGEVVGAASQHSIKPESQSSSASEPSTSTQPQISISPSKPTSSAPSTLAPTKSSQQGANVGDGEARRIRISPAPSGSSSLSSGGGPTAGRSLGAKAPPGRTGSGQHTAGDTLELWEDKTLSAIFRLTLDRDVRQDSHGNGLHFVHGTRAELDEAGALPRLTTAVLDQAILEAASGLKDTTPLDYLLGCWKRVSRMFRVTKSGVDTSKYDVLKEARRLCMSYCLFAVTMPDMFGLEAPASNPLTPHLLVDPEDDRGVCHDFLSEAVLRFDEDEAVKEALVGAVEELSQQLARLTMNDDFKPYVLALRNVVRHPPLVTAVVQSPYFLPATIPASLIEVGTLLGPFFQLSPFQSGVTVNYFSSPRTRDTGYITNSQKALRMTLQAHQSDLLDIVNHIIRASKESRDRVLDWFALTVNSNHKRRAMAVDNTTVSSDGFMVNVTVCLDQLCEPFMDATFSKIDRIDVDYLRREPRVDIREETKLNADQQASDAFYARKASGTSNFISEVFFLTLAAHHYGTEATSSKLDVLEKDLKSLQKRMEEFEKERPKWINTPQFPQFDATLKKYQVAIDKGLSYKYTMEGVLYDDLSQSRSMQFMRYVIVWLLRIAAVDRDYPKNLPRLPLREDEPEVFRCLPEYFLEDVVSNYKFIFSHLPHIVTSTQSDELVVLCITFLRSSEYIKNPYLKAGLVGILFRGIWPTYSRKKGILGDLLNSLPFATEHLLHALMKFYIEVENTGAHTQFYDKFNIRYEIFQVIKCIWSNPIYRGNLATESKINVDFFVRFVNLLLNDVTFVLDESLTAFNKIHDLQKELEDRELDAEARAEKEKTLAGQEAQARNYMQLTNETVAMLKLFTEALAGSFTMPEIVQRLADMLDYNLDAMVGRKSSNLKVQNPEKYGFDPKHLLSEIVDVYLHLRERPSFLEAVARDGRSYKPENVDKATVILRKWALKSSEEVAAWVALGEKFKQAKEADDQVEEDLGEIPDEFLDPLMYTLMDDPIILPASKVSIDRSTIRSHLLSDPNDPFNRAPLKIEDVIPDTELKARIEAFKAEKKGKKAPAGGEAMDVSEG